MTKCQKCGKPIVWKSNNAATWKSCSDWCISGGGGGAEVNRGRKDEAMSDKLKPCPFCGNEVESDNLDDDVMGKITCYSCDITMEASAVDNLVMRWNHRAEPAVDVWQPIETAPKDGTVIWVINGSMQRPVLAKFDEYYCHLTGETTPDWIVHSDPHERFMPRQYGSLVCPTKWQPLPNKPAAMEGK